MRKNIFLSLLIVMVILSGIYFASFQMNAKAANVEPEPSVIIITTVPPSSTPKPDLTPVVMITPSPTPTPELPIYDYPEEEGRGLSKAIFSGTPSNPTIKTKQAFAEIPQNMVDDYKKREANHEEIQYYKENIRYTLLMKTEFPSYDGSCYNNVRLDDERRIINDQIADYVMRTWYYSTITGDRSYRLTPIDGVRYSFYRSNGWDYIIVYDLNWNIVYDSGKET